MAKLEEIDLEFNRGSFAELTNLIHSRLKGASPREFAYFHEKATRPHAKLIIAQYASEHDWKFKFQYYLNLVDPVLGKRSNDTFAKWYQRKQKASESHTFRND